MPKTKFEEIFFSVLMALFMVYGMELYNLVLANGKLTNDLFLSAFKDLILLSIIVIILEKFIAGPIAKKLVNKLIVKGLDGSIFIIIFTSIFTVCLMCPMMSLVATFLFKHAGNQLISVWIQTTAMNFIMAFFWQLCFAGPSVRFIFHKVF